MTIKVVTHKVLSGTRLAEFFAGIGLVRLALEELGCRTVFANDISADKHEIYRTNFDSSTFVLRDVNRIRPEEVPQCDLATACFPCTDISLAGEREGLLGSDSSTFWGFIRILERKTERPRVILIENVEGLLSSNEGQDFRSVVSALNRLGYLCDPYVMDASFFVPQSRKRVLIVAAEEGRVLKADWIPPSSWVRPPTLCKAIARNSDLGWSFASVPTGRPELHLKLDDIIEDVPGDSSYWWANERVTKLERQMNSDHRKLVRWAVSSQRVQYFCVYRRTRLDGPRAEVRADGIAGCLRTARGGSSRQILVVAGEGHLRVRFMTPREYARLQGVPDAFELPAGDSKALFGLGDAVCIPVIQWLAIHCIAPLLVAGSSIENNARSSAPRLASMSA